MLYKQPIQTSFSQARQKSTQFFQAFKNTL